MSKGVIYYNTGQKCLPRLLVSLHSLRKHYGGPVTILSQGKESHEHCHKIAKAISDTLVYGNNQNAINVKEVDYGVPNGSNKAFLEACLSHLSTPYAVSMWLDADTIVRGGIMDILNAAEEHEFAVCQFANWTSSGRVASRIKAWSKLYPEWIEPALKFGPALNCGVFAFRREAKVMQDWYNLALPGRENFLADESCLQTILHRYPHMILPAKYNCSCKYGDVNDPDVRIIHYHGRKHCRAGLPFAGKIWMDTFLEVVELNMAGVATWASQFDGNIRKYLEWQVRS